MVSGMAWYRVKEDNGAGEDVVLGRGGRGAGSGRTWYWVGEDVVTGSGRAWYRVGEGAVPGWDGTGGREWS